LWGRTKGQLDADKSSISERYPAFCQGLEAAGMTMEFRAVREIPNDFEWRDEGDTMLLSFSLGRGSFATALLRECFDWSEAGAE
jgi:tRNA pseudouridine13 synthase